MGIGIAILEVEIQQERIQDGFKKLELPQKHTRLTDIHKANHLLEKDAVYETLMADIHLWLVAWGNINKLLRNLRKIMHDPRLDWIQERRRRWFLTINNARNSLEHIDERISNSTHNLPTIEDLFLEYHQSKRVNVFGVKIHFNDSSFNKIINLKKDLQRWYSDLPTVFDTLSEKYDWKVSMP
jgi:hypothetical protein